MATKSMSMPMMSNSWIGYSSPHQSSVTNFFAHSLASRQYRGLMVRHSSQPTLQRQQRRVNSSDYNMTTRASLRRRRRTKKVIQGVEEKLERYCQSCPQFWQQHPSANLEVPPPEGSSTLRHPSQSKGQEEDSNCSIRQVNRSDWSED